MDPFLAAILIGLPLAWLVGFAAYAYLDAPNYGMNPEKWAAISFFVPLFGFFAYLFERSETEYDPEEDPYAQGQRFEVHESRRGETILDPGGDDPDEKRAGDTGDRDTTDGKRDTTDGKRDTTDGKRDTTDEDDEWNDPPGVDI